VIFSYDRLCAAPADGLSTLEARIGARPASPENTAQLDGRALF